MIYNLPFIAVVAMIFIGLYAVLFKRNLVKMVIGISIIESGVNLFLITLGYRWWVMKMVVLFQSLQVHLLRL